MKLIMTGPVEYGVRMVPFERIIFDLRRKIIVETKPI